MGRDDSRGGLGDQNAVGGPVSDQSRGAETVKTQTGRVVPGLTDDQVVDQLDVEATYRAAEDEGRLRPTGCYITSACAKDPDTAYDYTARGNLVAVISNGTAVLGLGDIGALASKPVMEGKAVLFKRFADVDCMDIEVGTKDVDEFINCVRYLGPTFGGINLEDIKAPECFIIEQRLRELMDIPIFHDDQHGDRKSTRLNSSHT